MRGGQNAKDLTGMRFGRLVVVRRAHVAHKRVHWICRCDCGTISTKNGKYLLSRDTHSCGCELAELRQRGNIKHGGIVGGQTSPEYTAWRAIKSRCYVKSSSGYRFYGGRGILMSDVWRRDFTAFLRDVGPRPSPQHSIDRIDPNGPYTPQNCRWATMETQKNNTRRNVKFAWNGQDLSLTQIATLEGVSYDPLYRRVKKGQDLRHAIDHLRRYSVQA